MGNYTNTIGKVEKCLMCMEEFIQKRSSQKYCSHKCYKRFNNQKRLYNKHKNVTTEN